MNKGWGALLPICLAACSGGEAGGGNDKAVQACQTVFAMFEAEVPPERKGKIEKTDVKEDRVHFLIQTTNGLGETVFKDLECVFRLDRHRTEREATLKLVEIVEDKRFPFSLDAVDADLRRKGKATIARMLAEKGLDAIPPGETRLNVKE